MFTLVNTWTGHHWGKPGVLREVKLGIQLRLLLHFLKESVMSQVLCSAASQRGYCPPFPCREQSTAHADCGRALGSLSKQTPQWVIKLQLSRLLKFLGAALLSISCQEETSLWDRPKTMKAFLLLIIFLLPKSPEQIIYWSTPLHHYWGKTIGQNGRKLL